MNLRTLTYILACLLTPITATAQEQNQFPINSNTPNKMHRDPHYWEIGFEYKLHGNHGNAYSLRINIRDDYFNTYGFYYNISVGSLLINSSPTFLGTLNAGGHYIFLAGKYTRLRPILGFSSSLYLSEKTIPDITRTIGNTKKILLGSVGANIGGGIDVYFPNQSTIVESSLILDGGLFQGTLTPQLTNSQGTLTPELTNSGNTNYSKIYIGGRFNLSLKQKLRKNLYIQLAYDMDTQSTFLWPNLKHAASLSLVLYR